MFFGKSADMMLLGPQDPLHAFISALNPFHGLDYAVPRARLTFPEQLWNFAWNLVQQGVSLNVSLFIFNVFFPMYPADGSKLLVTSLMFFCGVPARTAALVLVFASIPCAMLLIGWAALVIFEGFSSG